MGVPVNKCARDRIDPNRRRSLHSRHPGPTGSRRQPIRTESIHAKAYEMSIGDNSSTTYETLRGRNYPAIRQFTIFLENRVGQLLEVVKRFEGTGIRVCALSINDAAECAFVRFLVSDADRGREILERSGLAIIETDLVGVELPEGPQPLLRVCTALLQAELNIIQAYPLIVRPHGKPAVAIMVESIEMAMQTLREKGFTIITEGDLQGDPHTD